MPQLISGHGLDPSNLTPHTRTATGPLLWYDSSDVADGPQKEELPDLALIINGAEMSRGPIVRLERGPWRIVDRYFFSHPGTTICAHLYVERYTSHVVCALQITNSRYVMSGSTLVAQFFGEARVVVNDLAWQISMPLFRTYESVHANVLRIGGDVMLEPRAGFTRRFGLTRTQTRPTFKEGLVTQPTHTANVFAHRATIWKGKTSPKYHDLVMRAENGGVLNPVANGGWDMEPGDVGGFALHTLGGWGLNEDTFLWHRLRGDLIQERMQVYWHNPFGLPVEPRVFEINGVQSFGYSLANGGSDLPWVGANNSMYRTIDGQHLVRAYIDDLCAWIFTRDWVARGRLESLANHVMLAWTLRGRPKEYGYQPFSLKMLIDGCTSGKGTDAGREFGWVLTFLSNVLSIQCTHPMSNARRLLATVEAMAHLYAKASNEDGIAMRGTFPYYANGVPWNDHGINHAHSAAQTIEVPIALHGAISASTYLDRHEHALLSEQICGDLRKAYELMFSGRFPMHAEAHNPALRGPGWWIDMGADFTRAIGWSGPGEAVNVLWLIGHVERLRARGAITSAVLPPKSALLMLGRQMGNDQSDYQYMGELRSALLDSPTTA